MGPEVEDKLDLYADTETDEENIAIGSEMLNDFDSQSQNDTETDELYNHVITSRVGEESHSVSPSNEKQQRYIDHQGETVEDKENDTTSSTSRKFNVYVGNLTWWTTDQDIENLLKAAGIEDTIEIKFFENRGNGQSKGYCNVIVGSEASIRMIHEKFPKKEVHGNQPVVAAPSKAALAQFDSQSKTRHFPSNNSGAGMGPVGCPPRGSMIPGMPPAYGMLPVGPRMMGSARGARCPGQGSGVGSPPSNRLGMSMGPHLPHHPQPSNLHRPPMPIGPYSHNSRPPFRPHHQPINMHCPVPPLNPGMIDHRGNSIRHEWMRPPVHPPYPYHPQGPPPPVGPALPPAPMIVGSPPSGHHGMPIPGPPTPAPHVNPAFFQPQYPGPVQARSDDFAGRGRDVQQQLRTNEYPQQPRFEETVGKPPHLSESEIEDIISRNRTVSSSAISRAVADASAGDFASAIETLVTAISLIRQSKVAGEERCKILITSLQDTLHGIESKGYSRSRSRGRSRNRSRSLSRERCRIRRSRYYRSRSPDSRGRSRSRERHHNIHRSRSSSKGREIVERPLSLKPEDRYRDRSDRMSHEHGDRSRCIRAHEEERDYPGRAEIHRTRR